MKNTLPRLSFLALLICGLANAQAVAPSGGTPGAVTVSGSTAANEVPTFTAGGKLQGFADFKWDESAGIFYIGKTAVDDGTAAYIETPGLISAAAGIQVSPRIATYPAVLPSADTNNLVLRGLTGVQVQTSGSVDGAIAAASATLSAATPLVLSATGTNAITSATANSGTNTAFKLNSTTTLSGSTLLEDLQNNGTSEWKVTNGGATTQLGGVTATTGTFSGLLSTTDSLSVSGVTVTTDGSMKYLGSISNNTTAYNASPVTGLAFGTKYTSGGALAGLGGLTVGKENATDANVASYLALHTRVAGGAITERLRLTSTGNLLVGTATDLSSSYLLQVNGTSYLNGNVAQLGAGFSAGAQTNIGLIHFNSTTAYNASPQAGWGGAVNIASSGAASNTHLGGIAIAKENATDGNALSYLGFYVSNGASVNIVEAGRFNSSKNLVLVGDADISTNQKLSLNGTTASSYLKFDGSNLHVAAAGNIELDNSVTADSNVNVAGTFTTNGTFVCGGGTTRCGTITLAAATSGTATVVSGCKPICTNRTNPTAVQCTVATTTLTATETLSSSDVIGYFCI